MKSAKKEERRHKKVEKWDQGTRIGKRKVIINGAMEQWCLNGVFFSLSLPLETSIISFKGDKNQRSSRRRSE